MRRGFTLIELLTVIAIMAMLGVAASSGYQALVRGMNERAAVAAAAGLLRSAKERAEVDRVPTAVYCYNKLLRGADDGESDENAIVVGVMTAVRRHSRLTFVRSKFLYDEFADLELTYDSSDEEAELRKGGGMKLYKFPPKTNGKMQYSIVASAVYTEPIDSEYSSNFGEKVKIGASAFYNLNSSKYEPTWTIGDAYAFEIGTVELPAGYIFGTDIPGDMTKISSAQVLYFDPENPQDKTVDIWVTRTSSSGKPEKWHEAGTASSDEEKTP